MSVASEAESAVTLVAERSLIELTMDECRSQKCKGIINAATQLPLAPSVAGSLADLAAANSWTKLTTDESRSQEDRQKRKSTSIFYPDYGN